jgi:hypothetical protein
MERVCIPSLFAIYDKDGPFKVSIEGDDIMSTSTAVFIFHYLSIVALLWFVYLIFRSRAARSWPTVVGKVIESKIELDTDSNAYPCVRYRYSFEGAEYVNDRILPQGFLSTTGGYAKRLVANYAEGRPVQVHVNPVRPTDSALEHKFPMFVYCLLIASALMFWLMGAMFSSAYS